MITGWWAFTLCVWAVACVATHGLRVLALRKPELLDRPNARSSHSTPTPRGGGAALVLGFALGILGWGFHEEFSWPLVGLLVSSLLVAWIGWRDDARGSSVLNRLATHFVAAGIFLLSLQSTLSWPLLVLGLLGLVWTLNLYNFMDGIDGLAVAQGITAAGTLAFVAWAQHDFQIASLCAWLCAACLGFLPLNWPPAKQFMGDVGSGFLGFALAALGIWGAYRGSWSIAVPLICLAPFVADSSWTLARRFFQREKVYEAHRKHAYQKAAHTAWGHRRVSSAVALHNIIWLAPLAWATAHFPRTVIPCLILAYLPSLYACKKFEAGK